MNSKVKNYYIFNLNNSKIVKIRYIKKVVIFFAIVAVAVCAPGAEEEAAKQKRQVLAYPGSALAAPLGWNGAYPYATGAWNGAYPYATGAWNGAYPYAGAWNGAFPYAGSLNGLGYPYAGLPAAARVAAPWAPAVAPWAPAVAPVVAARPALLG